MLFDIDTVRELAVEAKKQGFTVSDLAPHIRLHNFIRKSGASEEKLESFITNVSSNDISPEKVIELVNQLHDISKSEPIPIDQVTEDKILQVNHFLEKNGYQNPINR